MSTFYFKPSIFYLEILYSLLYNFIINKNYIFEKCSLRSFKQDQFFIQNYIMKINENTK